MIENIFAVSGSYKKSVNQEKLTRLIIEPGLNYQLIQKFLNAAV